MSQVSSYINNRDTQGFDPMSITDIYQYIKDCVWSKYVDPVRQAYGTDEYKKLKNTLPALTMSGIFPKGSRLNESIIEHSGRIVLDIDELEDSVYDAKEALKQDKYSEAVFFSVGGKGLAVSVKIDGKKHEESFEALQKYYKSMYGLKLDASCRNVARLRYVTSDPEIYINLESEKFEIQEEEKFISDDYVGNSPNFHDTGAEHTVDKEIIRRSVTLIAESVKGGVHHAIMQASELAGGYIAGGLVDEGEIVEAMLSAILQKPGALSRKEELKKINDGIRHGKTRPINELMVDASKSKEPRRFEFIKWYDMTAEEKAKHSNMIAEIRERHREGRDISNDEMVLICNTYSYDLNVYSMIKAEIWEKEKPFFRFARKNDIQQLEVLVAEMYDVRYNVIMDRTELYIDGKNSNCRDIRAEIYVGLKEKGYKVKLETVTQYLRSAKVKAYDPFKDYFDNLEPHDGKDYIKELCRHVRTNDDDFFYEMVKKHLVRSVKCSKGIEENRFVVVLMSEKQDIGKSRFIRELNPFGHFYFTESGIKSGGQEKDTTIALTQNFIYNVDELENVFRRNMERFKSMVSSYIINERGSHRQDAKMMVRRANFWASTNKKEFLEDVSNTRWLVFYVHSIDWAYSQNIDIHKVWAQAKALSELSYPTRLTKEEKRLQTLWNKQYEDVSTEELLVSNLFEKANNGGDNYMFISQIMEHIASRTQLKVELSPRKVGLLFTKLGFESTRKRMTKGANPQVVYFCKPVDKNTMVIKADPDAEQEPEVKKGKDPIPISQKKLF